MTDDEGLAQPDPLVDAHEVRSVAGPTPTTESETRYRALFERSPDALLVESEDGIVIDANPAARRLYGGDLVGRHVDDLVEGAGATSTPAARSSAGTGS